MDANRSIFELRRMRGISQTEMAEFLGISLQAYNGMESGSRETLTVDKLLLICEYMGLWPEKIFERGRRYE